MGGAAAAAAVAMATSQARHANARAMAVEATRKRPQPAGRVGGAPPQQAAASDVYPQRAPVRATFRTVTLCSVNITQLFAPVESLCLLLHAMQSSLLHHPL